MPAAHAAGAMPMEACDPSAVSYHWSGRGARCMRQLPRNGRQRRVAGSLPAWQERIIDCTAVMRIIAFDRRSTGRHSGRLPTWLSGSMPPFEIITIDRTVAACDGSGGALGHPMVYLNLAPSGKVECPYCSRLFVNRAMTAGAKQDAAPEPGSSLG